MANIYLKKINQLEAELNKTSAELQTFKKAHLIAMQVNRMSRGTTVHMFISILLTHLGLDAEYYDTILEMLVELKHADRVEMWINDELHEVDHTPYYQRKNAIGEVAYEILDLFNQWRTNT